MGITVAWDDAEQTIVRMNFIGRWTNDELRSVGTQSILMLRSTQHPVYVVSDFTASASVPVGVLWQARDLNQMRPSNWEAGITITQDALARNLLELFGVIYLGQRRKRIYAVRTVEEALELIGKLKRDKRTS